MSDAADFLNEWIASYILSEARTEDEADETTAELIEDAASEGISEEELRTAAKGNLGRYILRAIQQRAREL